MKSSHSCVPRWKTLPTTTPKVSSSRATVIPSSTDAMLATRTTAASTAASWTGSTLTSTNLEGGVGRGHQPEGRLGASLIAQYEILAGGYQRELRTNVCSPRV